MQSSSVPSNKRKPEETKEIIDQGLTKRSCTDEVKATALAVQTQTKIDLAKRMAGEKNLRQDRFELECEYQTGHKTLLICVEMINEFHTIANDPTSSLSVIELYQQRAQAALFQAANLKADLEKVAGKIYALSQSIQVASDQALIAQRTFLRSTLFRADLHLEANAEKTVFDAYIAGLPVLPTFSNAEVKEEKDATPAITVPKLFSIEEAIAQVNTQLENIGFNSEPLDVQCETLFDSVKKSVAIKDWVSLKEQIEDVVLKANLSYTVTVDTLDDLPVPVEATTEAPLSPNFLEAASSPLSVPSSNIQVGLFRVNPVVKIEQSVNGSLSLTS